MVPVFIAVQFVRKLSPNLRRYLRRLMRRPVTGAAVVCDGVALAGIADGTFSADHSSTAYLAAVAAAVLARLILWVYRRRRFGARSDLFNRTSLLVMLAFLLLFAATILIIAGTVITFAVAAGCVVASVYTSGVIYRRVRQR
jgi:hypothetical protein